VRILLDECLPRRLKDEFVGHEVATVPEMGWAGAKNGDLLRLAAPRFDVFVTIDQGLPSQQNLTAVLGGSRLGVVVLVARSNRLEALRPLVPELLAALLSLGPGDVRRVGGGNQRQAGTG
jgi:PIN like domain